VPHLSHLVREHITVVVMSLNIKRREIREIK